jgi:hypothetical protein
MEVKKHYALHGEELFDVNTSRQGEGDDAVFRVRILGGPRGSVLPTSTIELTLSRRQLGRLHVETEPWQ